MPTERMRSTLRRMGLASLLLAASAEFVLRGPVRFLHARDFNDLISPFIQTRAWIKGIDPYSPETLVELWPRDAEQASFMKRDLTDGSLVLKRGIPTAYPPTTFVLLAPIAWLPWPVAHHAWLAISLLAFGFTLLSLILLAGFQWHEERTYLFLLLAVALAPFHTGLASGSIVIIAVGFCAVGTLAVARQWNVSAGILFALAIGLKPQIGLPFLFFYLLRFRWRVVTSSVALLAILAGIAVFHLTMSHTQWLDNYRYDNRVLFAPASLGDFTESNPLRFGMVNLQVLIYSFVPNRIAANVAAILMASVLGLVWLLRLKRPTAENNGLLELAALTVLSLLPVYHRLYDASLLIFPLAWSLAALSESRKKLPKVTLLLILVFLVPGGSALEQLQHASYVVTLQHSWWWMHFVMPHQIWTLLALSVLLLVAMRPCVATLPVPSRDSA